MQNKTYFSHIKIGQNWLKMQTFELWVKIDESRKKIVISGPDRAEVTKNAKILVDCRSAEIFVFYRSGPGKID